MLLQNNTLKFLVAKMKHELKQSKEQSILSRQVIENLRSEIKEARDNITKLEGQHQETQVRKSFKSN